MHKKHEYPWGLVMLIGMVSIFLKVCEAVDWTWWIVLYPFYFPIIVHAITFGIFGAIAAVADFFDYARERINL